MISLMCGIQTRKKKKIIGKETIRPVVTRSEGEEGGEVRKGGQKVQMSSYKINTRDVMYNMKAIVNRAV